MNELNEIPIWMQKYIPLMTDGECETKECIKQNIKKMKPYEFGMIININIQIGLLNKLHDKKLI